ncbi:MAG: hypothetical protein KatS3mg089_0691 [Patescibacteria group bacterium]|nr:MAG: hypothetical protein KatS3mg089_0691 [Patescibacteria group bacterium]
MDQLKVLTLKVLIAIISFFIITKIFGPIPLNVNSIQTTKNDLFTVEGVGEATGIPKTAQFTVGVTETAATVEQAQSKVNTSINRIINELKKLGISDKKIKTINYNISPNIDYTKGPQQTTGYTVNALLEVKLDDTSKANQAVDTATRNGANIVNGVTFVLSDADREKLEKEARAKAIKDAKEKAQELSREVGLKIGRVISVNINPEPSPIIYKTTTSLEARGGLDTSTNLQPGENTIRVTVTISYETL